MLSDVKKFMVEQPLMVIISGLIIIFLLVIFIGIKIGQTNRQSVELFDLQPIAEPEKTEFRVRRVQLRKEDDSMCLEVNYNGLFRKYDCLTREVIDQGYLGFDSIDTLFNSFTQGDFGSWNSSYFWGDTTYTVIIETTDGTKTVTIQPGEGDLPNELIELIEGIEEDEGEVFVPTPSPGVIPTPSPTPLPPSTPTPSPGVIPTPSPTPLPSGVTPEPFSCDMLDAHTLPIIVSNIVCQP